MKNYKLIIKEEADEEIMVSFLWYESQQSGLGENFLEALDKCYHIIDINPSTFVKKYKEQRQAIVKGFPFVVMYELDNNKIVVYAVFHTSRDPIHKFR